MFLRPLGCCAVQVDFLYVFDCALAMNPSVVSLYWKDGEGKHVPKCFSVDGKVASVPIKIQAEGRRFEVKNIADSLYVQVRARTPWQPRGSFVTAPRQPCEAVCRGAADVPRATGVQTLASCGHSCGLDLRPAGGRVQ